jgi:transposase
MDLELAPPDGWGITAELWAQTPPAMRVIVVAMGKRIEQQDRIIQEQAKEIENLKIRVSELETKLRINSTNSSKPPSSDPPGTPRSKLPPSKRKRGGQPGHPGNYRMMHAHPDTVIDYSIDNCGNCGTSLLPRECDAAPILHQVTELPEPRSFVTEYRLHRRTCTGCGHVNTPTLPKDIAVSSFGPRLETTVALLAGRYRLSHREICHYIEHQWHAIIGLGSIAAILRRVSESLISPVEDAWNAVRASAVRYVDETGWREGNKRGWLWGAVGKDATAFHVAKTRGSIELQSCFGSTLDQGIVVSDRCRSYKIIDIHQRGVCHAHLKRDFVKMTEFGHRLGKEIGHAALLVHKKIFKLYRRFECGEMTRELLIQRMARHERDLKRLLERGRDAKRLLGKGAQNLQGMCRDILWHWPALWTFVHVDGVAPTNNAAERALRKAVLWRKGSFGTQSGSGSRFVERILTVTQTCVQQKIHAARYIEDAVRSARCGKTPTALILNAA